MPRFSILKCSQPVPQHQVARVSRRDELTMDDEHERQRRDLRRATRLLETMSREEMVEMLLDILSNERSDDTRKLSDWMAFQIILHDDIRRGHELLTQLGKVSHNHLQVIVGCD